MPPGDRPQWPDLLGVAPSDGAHAATEAVPPDFDELDRICLAAQSLESVLHRVTDLAARVLPGEPVTSVTILHGSHASTVASSDALARRLDEAQYRLGAGPSLTAAASGRPAEVRDTGHAGEWAEFAELAAGLGCGSALSYPLPGQDVAAGALTVYARDPVADSGATQELLSQFAAHAVVPLSNMYLYASAVDKARQLRAALESRAVIDQAKGILMERFKVTADQAFRALARVSMGSNTKVRNVAQRVVETGELPHR